jgi:hypothetical protein
LVALLTRRTTASTRLPFRISSVDPPDVPSSDSILAPVLSRSGACPSAQGGTRTLALGGISIGEKERCGIGSALGGTGSGFNSDSFSVGSENTGVGGAVCPVSVLADGCGVAGGFGVVSGDMGINHNPAMNPRANTTPNIHIAAFRSSLGFSAGRASGCFSQSFRVTCCSIRGRLVTSRRKIRMLIPHSALGQLMLRPMCDSSARKILPQAQRISITGDPPRPEYYSQEGNPNLQLRGR